MQGYTETTRAAGISPKEKTPWVNRQHTRLETVFERERAREEKEMREKYGGKKGGRHEREKKEVKEKEKIHYSLTERV